MCHQFGVKQITMDLLVFSFFFFGLKIPMDMLIVTHGDQMGEQLRVELCIYQAQ